MIMKFLSEPPPAGFFPVIVILIISVLSTFVSLLIIHPFLTLIVRYRANHSPRSVALPTEAGEENVAPQVVGPVLTGLWSTGKRVKQIEGWKGFYKGFMPTIATTLVFTPIAVGIQLAFGQVYTPDGSLTVAKIFASFAVMTILSLITLPVEILINRAIVTPYQLGSFEVKRSNRRLFTTFERKQPWMLFFTPGLVLSRLIGLFWILVVFRLLRILLFPNISGHGLITHWHRGGHVDPIKLTFYILFAAGSTFILCPLDILTLRLSIQKNRISPLALGSTTEPNGVQLAEEEEQDERDEADLLNGEVVALRNDYDPYLGLKDSVTRIAREEGAGALYRLWWLTLFGVVLAALGQ